jgi:uncharacterized OsmC-like protein
MSTASNSAGARPTGEEREVRSTATTGFRVDVATPGFAWTLDEPEDKGGTGSGPTPVQSLLGAVVGCLTMSFQFAAGRAGVPIARIEGWAASNSQRYITSVALELTVWSSAPEEAVRALLPRAERGCFVRQALNPDIPFTVDLEVVAAPEAGSPVS